MTELDCFPLCRACVFGEFEDGKCKKDKEPEKACTDYQSKH